MPTNTRELKNRITSVEKTKKITQAMKMVSAAKFKRNLAQLDHIKEFGEGIEAILSSLSKRLFEDDIPALIQENDSPQTAIIVVSSDRGLCGGFNSNLFKKVNQEISKYQQVDLYLIGNKAQQFFKSRNVKIADHITSFKGDDLDTDMRNYIDSFIDSFKQGVYSNVIVIYNEFVSALSSNQVVKQILPVSLPDWDKTTTTNSDFIYESSKENALESLFIKTIEYQFSRSVYESFASEEGFRMAAMDSATTNAKEMIQELTLFFNRSRQAAITTELTEIVAGAASIS